MKLLKLLSLTRNELLAGGLLIIMSFGIVSGSRLSRLYSTQSVSSQEPVDLYIEKKIDIEHLSHILADSGVINNREQLQWAGKLLGWKSFSPGHYQIEGDYSYDVFLSKLARGIQDPVQVIIVPGSTKERIASSIYREMKFDSAALYDTMYDSTILETHKLEHHQLLGRFLPNTYSFYWTSPPETVLKRIFDEFENRVAKPYRERIEELDKSIDEIITLASIIEWEANAENEKARISGLYWNRLRRGMLMQADPTINFALGERRRLLYEDYQINHPYNTYLHRGLPPGPITNPSLSSIEAALYPENHNYLYMVASPGGSHAFSETFEEHKRKSAEWREWLREQYRIKSKRENSNGEDKNS